MYNANMNNVRIIIHNVLLDVITQHSNKITILTFYLETHILDNTHLFI